MPEVVASFEILAIDGGSTDGTAAVADDLHDPIPRSSCAACRERWHRPDFLDRTRAARRDWFIVLSADLPIDVAELPQYFGASGKADVVVGYRSRKCDYSPYRPLRSWRNIRLIRLVFGMTETVVPVREPVPDLDAASSRDARLP